ncbi:MAG: vWA domain-containing protein, partial [Kiritimatiellia bacterium]|nr:vWA domain-containing protein [Kiritimatiellia bacterium]
PTPPMWMYDYYELYHGHYGIALYPCDMSNLVRRIFQPEFQPIQTQRTSSDRSSMCRMQNEFCEPSSTKRLAILLDVSDNMITLDRGGRNGFETVRNRIKLIVDSLSVTVEFTIIAYSDDLNFWNMEMKCATGDHVSSVSHWLEALPEQDLRDADPMTDLPRDHDSPRADQSTACLDLALSAAFKCRADTILIVCADRPRLKQTAQNEVTESGDFSMTATDSGAGKWSLEDCVAHIEALYESEYKPTGLELPVVHAIGYMVDEDGHEFLRSLIRRFGGQYRRLWRITSDTRPLPSTK